MKICTNWANASSCKALLLTAALALTACTHVPERTPVDPDAPVVYVEFNPAAFQADGKMAMRYPRCSQYRACQDEAVNVGLRWIHSGSREILALYDPMGQEAMAIDYNGGAATVREKGKTRYLTRDEMVADFGLPVPFESMAGWITTQRDVTDFEEQGWKVRLTDWKGHYYRSMRVDQAPYHMRVIIEDMYPIPGN